MAFEYEDEIEGVNFQETEFSENNDFDTDEVMTADDFFEDFTKEKESFEVPKPEKEPDIKKETSPDLFAKNSDTVANAILSISDRKKAATKLVNVTDNIIDAIGDMFTGYGEPGRYKPSPEHREIVIESVTDLLPDTFKGLPKWLEVALIILIAYSPVIKTIKEDRRELSRKAIKKAEKKARKLKEKKAKELAEKKELEKAVKLETETKNNES